MVDVDRIIGRERRGAVARRLAGVSTGGLALLVGAALVFGAAPGGSPAPIAVPAIDGVTAAPAPAEGFRLVHGTPAEADETARRLSAELDQAVLAAAPDRQWLFLPAMPRAGSPGEPPPPNGPLQMVYHRTALIKGEKRDIFVGSNGIAVGGRKGMLYARIVQDLGQYGSVMTRRSDEPYKGSLTHMVAVKLADGRLFVLTCKNDVFSMYARAELPPYQEGETPLSLSQLQAIANEVASKVIA
ncbi:hypothetical protein AB0B66_04925 [Catellatospora sp. NPDC049111]|uniref:hypothetical protein n=1 Tax=Catellatospora sp. NPDC049111 TaxID=3155271 RepID=UPI0033ED1664